MIRIIYLANAGILLEYGQTKLLIDGIYDEHGHRFSNLSQGQWDALRQGTGDFAGIDYLLFTHDHGDHFSAKRVGEYLQAQHPKAVFLPEGDTPALRALAAQAKDAGIPCVQLERELCAKTAFRPAADIRIKALPTRHLDRIYWDVPHVCLLIELGGKRLLFTADVDFTQEDFAALAGVRLDAVFVNPLLLCSKEGKALLGGALRAEKTFVYHIPFAAEDFMQIRKLAERERRTAGADTVFFMEAGQSCTL